MILPKLPDGLSSIDLTKAFAEEHVSALAELANGIPLVSYSEADILAETKGERKLYGKWLHGLAVVRPDGGDPIAYLGAYERAAEDNDQYPANTLYISELAVRPDYRQQGIASALMGGFLAKNDKLGLQVLEGDLNYSVQTNSASWNQPVIDLYKSFGFAERATKEYEDRTDVVLGRKPSE